MTAISQEVRFESSSPGMGLGGVITVPEGAPPVGLVLLLSGSGPQDRDQTVAGHATFRRLRERLAAAGFATASWDDRGVGSSDGDYLRSNSHQLVDDALACARGLRSRYGPALPLFLVGHSQGALIAARALVHRTVPVDGLVLLAGAGRPGRAVLLDQHQRICEAERWPDDEIESSLDFKRACFGVMEGYPETLTPQQERDLRESLDAIVIEHLGGDFDRAPILDDLMEWEWRFLLRSDPGAALSQVGVPTCIAVGTSDTQVNPIADLEGTLRALARGPAPAATVIPADGLNHLFQEATEGSPSAYETLGPPFVDRFLGPLVSWLTEQARPISG